MQNANNGIIICKCHGRVTDSVDMGDIVGFLNRMAPDIQIVFGDDLCQPRVLKRIVNEENIHPVAIGACSALQLRLPFWYDEPKGSIDPFLVKVLPMLEEAGAGLAFDEATQRIKLLLWAQIRRSKGFTGVSQRNLRMCIHKTAGEISRRNFASILVPHYEVVPTIDNLLCSGGLKCKLCRDICPNGAITIDGNAVNINLDLCSGCGACVAICPRTAVSYPVFSMNELDMELQGLLLCSDVHPKARIIALTDDNMNYTVNGDMKSRFTMNILPVNLPSMYMASPMLILRIFEMGASGLALIHNNSKNCKGNGEELWRGHIKFVQNLLELWRIEGHRVQLFDMVNNSSDDMHIELERFASEIARMSPTPFAGKSCFFSGIEGLKLSGLIKRMINELQRPENGTITQGVVPFGSVKIDGTKCTGCGLCASNCPTDAIALLVDSEVSSYSIDFKYDMCVGCGVCVNTCPENCIALEKVLVLSKLDASSTVIYSDSFIKCHLCGEYIAPRSMMEKLKARLQDTGQGGEEWTELCPDCRLRNQLQNRC